jgi:hypothetical protein
MIVPIYKSVVLKTTKGKMIAYSMVILDSRMLNPDEFSPLVFTIFKHQDSGNHMKIGTA